MVYTSTEDPKYVIDNVPKWTAQIGNYGKICNWKVLTNVIACRLEDVLSPFIKFQNSMGHQVQGEGHLPRHGPVPEATPWKDFTPADPEATISPDASATV